MPEPKTARYWQDSGHQFFGLSNCEACGLPVEMWAKGNRLIPVDKDTFEAHFSSCSKAQEYRTEMKLQKGVL